MSAGRAVRPGTLAAAGAAVKGFARSYAALFRLTWSEMLQYRAAVFLWTLWSLGAPIVHLSVWSAIAEAEGTLGWYDRGGIAAYFLVQSVVYHFTSAWQAYDFSYLIRTGTLSTRLLRPFDPSHYLVVNNVAFKGINLIWLVPIWVAMYLYYRPSLDFSSERIALFALALAGAAALQFLWAQAWAMIAFWTVRVSAYYEFADAIGYFIGGGLAPVGLLPEALRALSPWLHYYYVFGFPIEVAIGAVPIGEVWAGLMRTALWSIAYFALYRALWRRGVARFSAVGA